MKLVNLTPHSVTFLDGENNPVLTVEPSGVVACAAQTRTGSGEQKTVYIVSSLVGQTFPEQADVYVVDKSVRDGNGRIVCFASWITPELGKIRK